jgi:hypothetical protein
MIYFPQIRYLFLSLLLLLFNIIIFSQSSISLFSCQVPEIPDFTENRSYELGMKFKSSRDGFITGIRFWKAPSETGNHTGRIWDMQGNLLASVVFTNETSTQWQTQQLTQKLSIEKNKIYVVSVNANSHYVSTNKGLATDISNCILSSINDGKNGVFGDLFKFPTKFYTSSNYFRDVIMEINPSDACTESVSQSDTFIHRGYLGWINDLATSPRPNEAWPSIRIDDELTNDYLQTFSLMEKTGLNEISIWGLFAARSWPIDIEHTLDVQRTEQVLKIITASHNHGIKVLCGLGVYSWGFDEIIRANPGLGCSHNSSIMCPNNPDAWTWQKRIIDYIFTLPIDGVSMQIADQGRCKDCFGTDSLSDLAYHAIINDRVATYIRQTYPGKIIGINTYGMQLGNLSDLPAIKKMTAHADYLIDVNNTALAGGNSQQCNIVHAISPCAYGSLGGPGIEPPMHWERNRWFLPMLKRRSIATQKLFAGGGRAVENYMHLIKNPGEEVSLLLAAALEKNPSLSWEAELKRIINEIYQPKDAGSLQYLADLFIKAEDLYYEFATGVGEIISLEPLVSNTAGPAIYLRDKMTADGMIEYKKNLCVLRSIINSLKPKVTNEVKMNLIIQCIESTIKDLGMITGTATECSITSSKEIQKKEQDQQWRVALAYQRKAGDVKILIYNPHASHEIYCTVWDVTGKLLSKKKKILVQGNNEILVADEGLITGFYMLEVYDPRYRKTEHLKLFIQE